MKMLRSIPLNARLADSPSFIRARATSWFAWLHPTHPGLTDQIVAAELLATVDGAAAAVRLRVFVEKLVDVTMGAAEQPRRVHASLGARLGTRHARLTFGEQVLHDLRALVRNGNDGAHGRCVQPPGLALERAAAVCAWFGAREAYSEMPAPLSYEHNRAHWLSLLQAIVAEGRKSDLVNGWPSLSLSEQTHMGSFGPSESNEIGLEAWLENWVVNSEVFLVRSQETTTVIAPGSNGYEVVARSLPGLYFGHGPRVWEWATVTHRVPVATCHDTAGRFLDPWDDDTAETTSAVAPLDVGLLVCLNDGVVLDATRPDWLFEEREELWLPIRRWLSSRPLPACGQFAAIFAESNTYTRGAAHQNGEATFGLFDLGGATAVDHAGEVEAMFRRHPDLCAKRDQEWLAQGDGEGALEPPELALTLFEYAFPAAGRVVLRTQWTGGACYAESDGQWDDYTRSVLVDLDEVPAELWPLGGIPTAVLEYWRDFPEAFLGWSTIDRGAVARIAARTTFDEGV